jgi:murein DD-endopeptidase MepM/ murein hydrolase activator NlpD
MDKIKLYLKQSLTSITIMVIPHSRLRPMRMRVSAIGLVFCLVLSLVGAGYVLSVGIRTAEYYGMRKKLTYFSSQFLEMKVVMSSLQKTESEFSRLLDFKSKKKILDRVDVSSNLGSLDIDLLKKQVDETIQSVAEIREYIKEAKSLYLSTPDGWPVKGNVSSPFGTRVHPITGKSTFHSGLDISTPVGTMVKATADGIVSFSNWHNDSGYIVVLEHGHGFRTIYAHNKLNYVKVGQRVKRGDIISLSGSTGSSTGPHVHYEVWKNGTHVNPYTFLRNLS